MRKKAHAILVMIDKQQTYSNIALNQQLSSNILSNKDRELMTKLVYGTLQNKLYLQYQLSFVVKSKMKIETEWNLLMALYQYLFLDKIPDYAIINEAVLIAKFTNEVQSKFVNATLRQYFKIGPQPIEAENALEYLSIKTSHPLWMVKMFAKYFGEQTCALICESNNEVPRLSARINTLETSIEAYNHAPWKLSELSDVGIISEGQPLMATPDYIQGLLTIQDESSQLVAPFLGPKKGSCVLDMCSAPGSKTTHLAQIMENEGHIVAVDIFEHKLKLVNASAQRMGIDIIETIACDATTLGELYDPNTFDYILLDGPCSGLGVLRRKPEIKYKAIDFDGLIQIQAKLLDVAVMLLKEDGHLVYSTCTLSIKENEKQIEAVMKRHPSLILEETKYILPHSYHSDGFYMAKLTKKQ